MKHKSFVLKYTRKSTKFYLKTSFLSWTISVCCSASMKFSLTIRIKIILEKTMIVNEFSLRFSFEIVVWMIYIFLWITWKITVNGFKIHYFFQNSQYIRHIQTLLRKNYLIAKIFRSCCFFIRYYNYRCWGFLYSWMYKYLIWTMK